MSSKVQEISRIQSFKNVHPKKRITVEAHWGGWRAKTYSKWELTVKPREAYQCQRLWKGFMPIISQIKMWLILRIITRKMWVCAHRFMRGGGLDLSLNKSSYSHQECHHLYSLIIISPKAGNVIVALLNSRRSLFQIAPQLRVLRIRQELLNRPRENIKCYRLFLW